MEDKSRHSIYFSNALWNALLKKADEQGVSVSLFIERMLLKEMHATLDDLVEEIRERDEESACIKRVVEEAKRVGVRVTIAPACNICHVPHRCKSCGYVGYLKEYSIAGVLCVACNRPIRCYRPITIADT